MIPLKFISASTRLAVAVILLGACSPLGWSQTSPASPSQTPASTPVQKPQTPVQPPAPPPIPPQAPAKPADQANDTPYVYRARADLVNLVFTVTDKEGHFKKDLRRENFGLLDNGRPPAEVIGFTQQTNLPLRIGIMLDTSSSIRTRFKFEQESALDFFLELLKPGDRAFVEGFDVQIALTQDYTGNVDLLNQGIQKLRPGGGTALFNALYKTCQTQMLTLRDATDVRKVIILVSDGDDQLQHGARIRRHQDVPARRDGRLRHLHRYQPHPRQGRRSVGNHRQGHRRSGLLSRPPGRYGGLLQKHRGRTAQPVFA